MNESVRVVLMGFGCVYAVGIALVLALVLFWTLVTLVQQFFGRRPR